MSNSWVLVSCSGVPVSCSWVLVSYSWVSVSCSGVPVSYSWVLVSCFHVLVLRNAIAGNNLDCKTRYFIGNTPRDLKTFFLEMLDWLLYSVYEVWK